MDRYYIYLEKLGHLELLEDKVFDSYEQAMQYVVENQLKARVLSSSEIMKMAKTEDTLRTATSKLKELGTAVAHAGQPSQEPTRPQDIKVRVPTPTPSRQRDVYDYEDLIDDRTRFRHPPRAQMLHAPPPMRPAEIPILRQQPMYQPPAGHIILVRPYSPPILGRRRSQ